MYVGKLLYTFYLYTSVCSLNLYLGQVRLLIQIGHRDLSKAGLFQTQGRKIPNLLKNIWVIEPMELTRNLVIKAWKLTECLFWQWLTVFGNAEFFSEAEKCCSILLGRGAERKKKTFISVDNISNLNCKGTFWYFPVTVSGRWQLAGWGRTWNFSTTCGFTLYCNHRSLVYCSNSTGWNPGHLSCGRPAVQVKHNNSEGRQFLNV